MKKLLTLLIVFFVQQLYAQTPVVQSLQPTITQQNYSDPTTIHYHVELNGYINPNGIPCEIYFEYGNTAAYGNIVAASPATLDGSAASTVNFSFEVSHTSTSYNLNNYHCRLRMVTAQGTYYSSNMPFTVNPDPVRWIEIIPTYNDNGTYANFDITNGKNIEGSNGDVNDVINIQYTSNELNGYLDLTPLVTQHLNNTYKYAVAAFYLNGISEFKQLAANNLYSTDDPLPIHNVQVFAQGSVNNGEGQLYRLKNNNGSAITVTLLSGFLSQAVTIPANDIVEVVTVNGYSLEVEYEGATYQVVSHCEYTWEGNRWVTVVPISADTTTATFELLNNDDIAHTMILDNGEGIEHSYTLPANSNQIVTIENYLWDIYLSRPYTLVSEGEYTIGDHFKIDYINPGFAQLYVAPTTSAPTLVTSNSMTLNGKITSTIARDQQVEYYFAYGTDKENLDTQTGTLTATAVDGPGTAVSAAITELTGLTKYYFRLETLSGGVSAIDSITTVANPNAPVLADIEGSAINYTERQGIVPVTSTITVTDANDANIESAVVRITGNYQIGQDFLFCVDQNGITATWTAATGTLTLTGNVMIANYRTAIRSITYYNTSYSPSTLQRTISITVSDGDYNSNTVTRLINVSSVNNAPVLNDIEETALDYLAGSGSSPITNTMTVIDQDNANLASATIGITNNYLGSEDELTFTNQNGIAGVWDSGEGMLTLTGSSTVENYQTALLSVKYHNTNGTPSILVREVSISVSDGGGETGNSNIVTREINISVASSNVSPELLGIEDTSLVYIENDIGKVITNKIIATDKDGSIIDSAEVRIIGNFIKSQDTLLFVDQNGIKGTWLADSGMIKMKGSSNIGNYQMALRSVKYYNTSEAPDTSTRKIGFVINDGDTNSDTLKRKICIISINDIPLLSPTMNGVLYYTEGDTSKVIADTIIVSDVDDTNIDSALIRISVNYRQDEDELIFSNKHEITGKWEKESGTMMLTGTARIADYQTALRSVRYFNSSNDPDTKVRTVMFMVNDGETDSDTSIVKINIKSLNDPPVLANIETIPLRYVIKAEGLSITDSLELTDDEMFLESALISITANYQKYEDKLLFEKQNGITGTWDRDKGTLTLKGTSTLADYKSAMAGVKYYNSFLTPTETIRKVDIVVSDGDNLSNIVSREIVITGQTTAPVLSNVENESIKYKKGDEDVLITNTIKVYDTDNKYLFEGKVSITEGFIPGEDELVFENQTSITGSYDAASGIITFKGQATLEEYQKILRTVRYRNTKGIKAETSVKKIIFEVRDGEWISNKACRYIEVVSPISTPTNLTIEVNDKWEAVLNWEDNSSNEDGFVVGRVEDNSIKLDSVKANTTSFIDDAVKEGKYYTYGVLAYNNLGVVSDTTNDNISSILIPLKPPTDLKAVASPEGKIDLSWIDNSSADVIFTVERSDEVNNDFKELHKCKKDSTKHCDKKIKNNCKYYYRVYALKDSLRSNYSNVIEVIGTITEVNEELTEIPKEYKLYTNYPNPFNPSTVIKFDIPKDGKYVLKVYNILGEVVKVLADKEFTAGRHNVTFDATNISSGVYFYQLTGESQNLIKKMLLMK